MHWPLEKAGSRVDSKRLVPIALALIATTASTVIVLAVGQIDVSRSVLGSGGGASESATLRARSTLGQSVVGEATSGSLSARSGFWPPQFASVTAVGPEDPPSVPVRYELLPNSPNPFNPRTSIRYSLPVASRVRLMIYDTKGRLVRTLVNQVQGPGDVQVIWDGTDETGRTVASGVYVYQLQTPQFTQSRKMALVR